MAQVKTARELYYEILKFFYFGIYRKGERLMTYKEVHEIYGLAKNTIAAAYAMLRNDGFIHTCRSEGTIVTFDVNNPEHITKVPLEWSGLYTDRARLYEVPIRLHAGILQKGLMHSSEIQIKEYKELTKDILRRMQNKYTYYEQVLMLWMCIISALDNQFLNYIADHFINQYMYFTPPDRLSSLQRKILHSSALEFYEFLLNSLEQIEFCEFPDKFWRYYNNYFREGGIVFAKLEYGTLFKEQALYGKVMDELCIKIMVGNLRKGDSLPTTAHLCAEHGVSRTTVNRAYGILMDMGIISRRARSGTKLVAEPCDPVVWETLKKVAGFHQRNWKDAVEVILMINDILNQCLSISSEVVQQMYRELTRQKNLFDRYSTPFLVSDILISPLIADLPTGILHQYYFYLIDTLNRIMTLCTFHVHGNWEHGEKIYQMICDTLNVLQYGEQESFAVQVKHTIHKNIELLVEDFNSNTR